MAYLGTVDVLELISNFCGTEECAALALSCTDGRSAVRAVQRTVSFTVPVALAHRQQPLPEEGPGEEISQLALQLHCMQARMLRLNTIRLTSADPSSAAAGGIYRTPQLTTADAASLAALTSLFSLEIRNLKFHDAVQSAAHLAALTQLTSLSLYGCCLGPEAAQALTALTRLVDLDIGLNATGPDALADLLGTLGASLQSLHAYGNNLGPAGRCGLLAVSSSSAALRHLACLGTYMCCWTQVLYSNSASHYAACASHYAVCPP